MKKFNVKALSLAIAAAVVSSAAGAAERDLGSIPEKAQNAMAFQTVFGENTKFDQDTGKFTFDKESSALLLKTMELEQAVNGFAAGSNFVATNEDGSKTVREATQADVEADGFGGLGLKEVVAAHDEALGDLTETVNDNSEALVKTAEVVNAISADVNANKAALEEQKEANEGFNNAIASLDKDIVDLAQAGLKATEALEANRKDIDANTAAIETKADKADFEELAKYTADMGKKVNDIGDEVTALSDATSAAITRHDKDIVDLAQAGLKATEALEANRKDIDANTAAIETKADKADFEELAKYTADMGKKVNDIGDEVTALSDATSAAITRHDKDIVDLAQAGLKATEALEANRKDIDANKKYIGDLALAGKAAADALEANRQDIDANKAAIAENTAKLEEQKEANEGFNNAIASLDKDIGDLALAGKAAADALEANRQDIDANKAAIAENTAKLEEQKEANEGFNNAIASLDKDIGDLALAGKAAADALEANRQDIDANKAAIETKADKTAVESVRTIAVEAQKSAQVVKGAVEVAQKSAETAESHAKAAKTSADAANNVASAAQTAAAQAQDAVKANATQVAANKADIATLQTASNQHAAGIAKNSARIDNLDKNVANLRKETRQGLAAQAALSGLFQPYSVGKFNVTAALGGFKSDTAVAVGAGYRFNENFAAKAGLAVGTSSGGSASYNVGVNYEW
ncbi:YadA-like family protein [Neisseria sp. P0018.S004]|uniref:YadA C-terminal domain-containing protein n=3 Tax=Neisseria TaxID=482 RepID=UPI003F809932